MCKTCNKKKPCKKCKAKEQSNIIVAGLTGNLSVDEIIAKIDLVGVTASILGVAVGEAIYIKVRDAKWGNLQFRLFLVGLGALLLSLYGNAVARSSFMRGFWAGMGGSNVAMILRASGSPAFSGLVEGKLFDKIGTIVEITRNQIGMVKKYPSVDEAKAKHQKEAEEPLPV